jgi:hypothetical protein
MADNISLTPGTGATFAADEVIDGTLGTVKVGFGKIMDGTLDSTNKLVVDSTGALSSNQTRINSTTIDTNSGVKSSGTQRVVLATDQPQLTNALKVDGSAVTQPVSGSVTADTELPTAAALSDADAAAPTVPTVGAYNMIANAGATAATRMRGAGNGLNSTGTGIAAAQVIAQFDDVSPTAITENSFGNLRMSNNRNLYGTIRDAAGNERGANVTASNALLVDLSATAANATAIKVDNSAVTQPVSGTVAATQSGTWTVQPGNTANTTAWLMKLVPKSVSSQTALTTTATVTSAAGTYVGGSYINLNSAPAYLQVFDTTGAVTLGTTVPTFVQPIPANATAANGAAFVFDVPGGIGITNGIKVAATTTATGATTVTTALIGYTIYT